LEVFHRRRTHEQFIEIHIAAVVVVVDVAARLAVLGDLLQLLDEAIGTVRTGEVCWGVFELNVAHVTVKLLVWSVFYCGFSHLLVFSQSAIV
jgi:hypothetical protein